MAAAGGAWPTSLNWMLDLIGQSPINNPSPLTQNNAPGGAPAPGTPAPPAVSSTGDTPGVGVGSTNSAKDLLRQLLDTYGLGDLADVAWQSELEGTPPNAIMLTLRNTPQYKARFPAMDALAKKGIYITEQQYVDLEQQYTSLMRAAGLPAGFYDNVNDFSDLIAGEVSPSELQERLKIASTAAFQSPDDVKAQLASLYGIDQGHLTAYWLDPDKALPMIQQQFTAAQLAAEGTRTGYGQVTRSQAEEMANFGVTDAQAQKGFQELFNDRQLFNPLPGEQGTSVDQEQQIQAAFGGNAAIQEQIANEAAKRKAAMTGGGGYAESNQGILGLQQSQT